MKQDKIHKFVGDQLSQWPLACSNFRALKDVKVREIEVGGLTVKLQFNPARMISSAAKLNKEDIAKRRCFLCRENRPVEQIMLKFEGRKNKKYDILVNPYPIFPDHLVIAKSNHTDQSIWHRYVDMLDLARKYTGYTFFYNGPKSGASAPDHHHFQGAPKGLMPLENDVNACIGKDDVTLEYLTSVQDASLYHYKRFTTGVFVLRAETAKSAAKLFGAYTPIMFVRGNHEYRGNDALKYLEYMDTPTGKTYYSYNYGDHYFIVLDGGEDKHDSDIRNLGIMITEDYVKQEAEWLKEVVKSEEFRNAKTRIVFCHMQPGENGWHGQKTISKYLVPVLNEAGIDVMLCGHIHKYKYYEPGTTSADFPVICNPNAKRMDATVKNDNIKLEFIDQEKVVKTLNIKPGAYKK